MTHASLVVMAAGLGGRFGGVKQLAAVGPAGEVILDYTIRDAVEAGLDEVVLIVRNDIKADTEAHVRSVHGPGLHLTMVCQDDLGPPRDKPWGTVHAVLSAAEVVSSPFVLANADDYYGPKSFQLAVDNLSAVNDNHGLLVAFELGKTLPENGSVTRGVCNVVNGRLAGIDETGDLNRRQDGSVGIGTDRGDLDPTTPVSMNLWAFDQTIMDKLRTRWDVFYDLHADDPGSECLLPTEVGVLMTEDGFLVDVVASPETWTGLTNPDDLEDVRSIVATLRS